MATKINNSGSPLSESDIVRFESHLDITLPEEYRNFLLQHNGGEPEPDEFVVPGWSGESSAISRFFSIVDNSESGLTHEITTYRNRIPDSIIPIGVDPGDNLICIGVGEQNRGVIFFWDHDDELDDNGTSRMDFSNVYTIAGNLEEFLENLKSEI